MKASFRKSGDNFLPVIVHEDGRREVIYGPPLVTSKRAKFYAELEIRDRRPRKEKSCTYTTENTTK